VREKASPINALKGEVRLAVALLAARTGLLCVEVVMSGDACNDLALARYAESFEEGFIGFHRRIRAGLPCGRTQYA